MLQISLPKRLSNRYGAMRYGNGTCSPGKRSWENWGQEGNNDNSKPISQQFKGMILQIME